MTSRFTRRQALACTAATVAGGVIPITAAANAVRPDAILAAVAAWAAAATDESAALHEYTDIIDAARDAEGRRVDIWHMPAQQEILARARAATKTHRAAWHELEWLLFGVAGGLSLPKASGYERPAV